MQRYLHESAVPWSEAACSAAARSSHLHVLRWLREQGCPWQTDKISAAAAYSGSTELLQYTRRQGVEYTADTLNGAAQGGSLQCVQYLLAEGCPCCLSEVLMTAAFGGSVEVLQFLLEQQQQQPTAKQLTLMLNAAGANGQLAAAQLLRQRGAEWPAVLKLRIGGTNKHWTGATLDWARQQGCSSPIA
jgi:Ankyrin repeats (3 copies)